MNGKTLFSLLIVLSVAGSVAFAASKPASDGAPPPPGGKSPADIVIAEGDITDRPYRVLGDIAVSVNKVGIIDVPPIRTKVENALRAKAAAMGADAVIQVRYVEHGFAMLIRARMEGLGRAVVFRSGAEASAPAVPGAAGQPLAPMERQIPSQADMKAKLQAYLNAVNVGDAAAAIALFADDATIEDPLGSAVQQGKPAIEAFVRGLVSRRTNFELVTPIRGSNTNAAAIAVKARVGTAVVNIIETYTFNPDGRISSMRAYWGSEDREN